MFVESVFILMLSKKHLQEVGREKQREKLLPGKSFLLILIVIFLNYLLISSENTLALSYFK